MVFRVEKVPRFPNFAQSGSLHLKFGKKIEKRNKYQKWQEGIFKPVQAYFIDGVSDALLHSAILPSLLRRNSFIDSFFNSIFCHWFL